MTSRRVIGRVSSTGKDLDEYEERIITADVTATGTITEISGFTTTPGETYEVSGQLMLGELSNSANNYILNMEFRDGSNTVGRLIWNYNGAGSTEFIDNQQTRYPSFKWVAQSNSFDCVILSLTDARLIGSAGNKLQSFLQVEHKRRLKKVPSIG